MDFSLEEPRLVDLGKSMLLYDQPVVGLGFLATIRKDGGPRLHPVSLVFYNEHLYIFIPSSSPKCADLLRDNRYALQAFPPSENPDGKEFYLSGNAIHVSDPSIRSRLISELGIHVDEIELLFELYLDRAMYTVLVNRGTPDERPWHQIWRASSR